MIYHSVSDKKCDRNENTFSVLFCFSLQISRFSCSDCLRFHAKKILIGSFESCYLLFASILSASLMDNKLGSPSSDEED